MINYYAPVVYANAMHLSRNLSLILGGCTSLAYLAASFIPLWTVEKFGRRALLHGLLPPLHRDAEHGVRGDGVCVYLPDLFGHWVAAYPVVLSQ